MKQPILLQRIEGALIFLISLVFYYFQQANWLVFILVFFAIDISMAGYLMNKKVGAHIYNIGHSFIMPIIILVCSALLYNQALTLLALIWTAHIGIDRALGYGFKLPSGFKDTHLGRIGK
jgi:hypothetical protein